MDSKGVLVVSKSSETFYYHPTRKRYDHSTRKCKNFFYSNTVLLINNIIQENVHLSSTESIRDVITELLSQCNIPYYQTPYDQDLHDLCIQECKLKRYPIDKIYGKASIAKYIPCGVIIASTGYAHLKNRSTQVFIAIYTAFLTWIDDTYSRDVIGVDCFNERFVTGQKQANEGLDGLDRLLRETNLHYHSIQANVILTASLNFVTSTILDFETQGMAVSFYYLNY